jgi:hypothetical protein
LDSRFNKCLGHTQIAFLLRGGLVFSTLFVAVLIIPFTQSLIIPPIMSYWAIVAIAFVIGTAQSAAFGWVFQLASLFPPPLFSATASALTGAGVATLSLLTLTLVEQFQPAGASLAQLFAFFLPAAFILLFLPSLVYLWLLLPWYCFTSSGSSESSVQFIPNNSTVPIFYSPKDPCWANSSSIVKKTFEEQDKLLRGTQEVDEVALNSLLDTEDSSNLASTQHSSSPDSHQCEGSCDCCSQSENNNNNDCSDCGCDSEQVVPDDSRVHPSSSEEFENIVPDSNIRSIIGIIWPLLLNSFTVALSLVALTGMLPNMPSAIAMNSPNASSTFQLALMYTQAISVFIGNEISIVYSLAQMAPSPAGQNAWKKCILAGLTSGASIVSLNLVRLLLLGAFFMYIVLVGMNVIRVESILLALRFSPWLWDSVILLAIALFASSGSFLNSVSYQRCAAQVPPQLRTRATTVLNVTVYSAYYCGLLFSFFVPVFLPKPPKGNNL